MYTVSQNFPMVAGLKTHFLAFFQAIVYSAAKFIECQLFARHCVRLRM